MKKHGAEEEIYLLVPHNIFTAFSSIFPISEIFIRVSGEQYRIVLAAKRKISAGNAVVVFAE